MIDYLPMTVRIENPLDCFRAESDDDVDAPELERRKSRHLFTLPFVVFDFTRRRVSVMIRARMFML